MLFIFKMPKINSAIQTDSQKEEKPH